ncbi:tryptophan 7-halogenase [Gordonia sp. NB41Y]|uniref:tryptophan 7-halogenase n=1 Tax=Gordonia sp. NB41Y TaxID=875808 RepID=UPI0006B20830|nr:tryptophan 7-halogenase [Gordonia sp. NB41Y]KOY49772.1 tryptophan halogenase [Gordonia sp. NB41Y]WLP90905.1 tryptophan 7-halogenase [Gordonia sp. NB41Y]
MSGVDGGTAATGTGPATAEEADVVVIGGGPGGSTTATLLAKSGRRVIQLEKESFPRYQIGESLLPSTIHGVCKLLGCYEKVRDAGFMHKRGGSFRWGTNPVPWNFLFAISPEFAGEGSYAYQVERMKFDKILLDNAAENGVDVRQECRVNGVDTDDSGRVVGVRYVDADRTEHDIRASYVVDASGNSTRLTRHAGAERVYSDFFQNVAVFGYFEGGRRLPAPDSGNILCAAFDEGWIWYIPLSDTLTSVGVVIAKDKAKDVINAQEETLLQYIDRCTIVRDMLVDATRVTEGTCGEIRLRKDYSYANTRFWGNGMVLVGDAACFIDPVFSTGVHLATYSGVLAARSINSVLDGTMTEERAFTEFEGRYRREYAVFYEFLSAFYDMEQSEDSSFWKARKVTNFDRTDMAAFVSLVAGGYSGEDVLTDAAQVIERFRSSSDALTAAAAKTGGMDTDSGQRMGHMFSAPVVREVMEEMNALQARGAVTEGATEPPLLDGGLVPSADGLAWAEPADVHV